MSSPSLVGCSCEHKLIESLKSCPHFCTSVGIESRRADLLALRGDQCWPAAAVFVAC